MPLIKIIESLISPVFAEYLNFPDTLIQVSDIEILYSDLSNCAIK